MLARLDGSKGAPLFPRAMNSSHKHTAPGLPLKLYPSSTKPGTWSMFNIPMDELIRMALAHHTALGGSWKPVSPVADSPADAVLNQELPGQSHTSSSFELCSARYLWLSSTVIPLQSLGQCDQLYHFLQLWESFFLMPRVHCR